MTILFAGHDTTSNSTAWALHILAKHQDAQDLLREELVKAFPDKSNFNPTYDEINALEYLNCVIKETLRMHSPGTNLIWIVFNKSNFYSNLIIFTLVPTARRTNLKDEVF